MLGFFFKNGTLCVSFAALRFALKNKKRRLNEASATYTFAAVEAELLDKLIFLIASSRVLFIMGSKMHCIPSLHEFPFLKSDEL